MGSIGAPELIIVLLVVLLLFGSTKLPKLARSIGEASKEFKKGVNDGGREAEEEPAPKPVAPVNDTTVTLTAAEYEALRAQREQAPKDTPPR